MTAKLTMLSLGRLLTCLSGFTLLSGCQMMESIPFVPEQWPWEQQEAQPAANPPPQIQDEKIAALIDKGNLALTKDRLSVPANDNAVRYFREVLSLEPGNAKATAGLKKVAKRYRQLSRASHNNGNSAQAQKYLSLAESITGPDHPGNRKLRRELQENPSGQDQRALDHSLKEKLRSRKNELQQKRQSTGSIDETLQQGNTDNP